MDPIIKEVFDPRRVVELLADIWGREHGCEVKITLTPKDSPASPPQEEAGVGNTD